MNFQELFRGLNHLESLQEQITSLISTYDLDNFDPSQVKKTDTSLKLCFESITKLENSTNQLSQKITKLSQKQEDLCQEYENLKKCLTDFHSQRFRELSKQKKFRDNSTAQQVEIEMEKLNSEKSSVEADI